MRLPVSRHRQFSFPFLRPSPRLSQACDNKGFFLRCHRALPLESASPSKQPVGKNPWKAELWRSALCPLFRLPWAGSCFHNRRPPLCYEPNFVVLWKAGIPAVFLFPGGPRFVLISRHNDGSRHLIRGSPRKWFGMVLVLFGTVFLTR